jgi:hypothetical protein
MGTSALILVTGTGPDGPETTRLYRHYDGYPSQTLVDIARFLPKAAGWSPYPSDWADDLQELSMDKNGKSDFRIEGGPWPRAANPSADDGGDVAEWYYRIDADLRRVDVHGRYGDRFFEGTIPDFEKRGPVSPIPAGETEADARAIEKAVAALEAAGFGVSREPPSLERDLRDAEDVLLARRRENPGARLADVYDSDPELRRACATLFPEFEYPDHSWRTLRDLHYEGIRAADALRAEAAGVIPPNGHDLSAAKEGSSESLGSVPGEKRKEIDMPETKERKEAKESAGPGSDKPFAIAVPFADKDEARKAGAVWFGALKTWAIPEGATTREQSKFSKWFPKDGDDASENAIKANAVFADATGRKAQSAFIEACADAKATERSLTQMVLLGADPCAANSKGTTGLHKAAESGNVEAVALLLAAGADPRAADHKQRTPLHKAAYYGRAEAAEALLAAGADPRARDADGASPEDHAALGLARARGDIARLADWQERRKAEGNLPEGTERDFVAAEAEAEARFSRTTDVVEKARMDAEKAEKTESAAEVVEQAPAAESAAEAPARRTRKAKAK